jgi:predicted phosphodiesterase
MIRGNSEDYVLAYDAGRAPEAWLVGDQWATLRWSYRQLCREAIAYIGRLPSQRVLALNGASAVRVVHGSSRSSLEFLYPDGDPAALEWYRRSGLLEPGKKPPSLAAVLADLREKALVCAHSHIAWIQEVARRLVVNPGGVGGSDNGDTGAQYAVLEWHDGRWRASLCSVPYDLAEVRAAYQNSGLLEAGGVMAEAFLLGILSAQDVPGRFVRHVGRLTAAEGNEPGGIVPDEVWHQAIDTFAWADYHESRSGRS